MTAVAVYLKESGFRNHKIKRINNKSSCSSCSSNSNSNRIKTANKSDLMRIKILLSRLPTMIMVPTIKDMVNIMMMIMMMKMTVNIVMITDTP